MPYNQMQRTQYFKFRLTFESENSQENMEIIQEGTTMLDAIKKARYSSRKVLHNIDNLVKCERID